MEDKMPHVEVKDTDGKVLRTYEIIVAEYGTLVTDDDLCDEARRNAVDDELVSEDRINQLTFAVVK